MRLSALLFTFFIVALAALFFLQGTGMADKTVSASVSKSGKSDDLMDHKPDGYPVAVFAGGCFWCVESEFRAVNGVLYTRVGYTGGHIDHPRYEDTHNSKSGHAEAVEVTYDPKQVSFKDLVEFFLVRAHDPTQLNRQGPDVGTQYRSAIFYQDAKQKRIAQEVIDDVNARKIYDKPIVTTLEPAATFWQAENYHQQYYEKYEKKYGHPHINDWLNRQRDKMTK